MSNRPESGDLGRNLEKMEAAEADAIALFRRHFSLPTDDPGAKLQKKIREQMILDLRNRHKELKASVTAFGVSEAVIKTWHIGRNQVYEEIHLPSSFSNKLSHLYAKLEVADFTLDPKSIGKVVDRMEKLEKIMADARGKLNLIRKDSGMDAEEDEDWEALHNIVGKMADMVPGPKTILEGIAEEEEN